MGGGETAINVDQLDRRGVEPDRGFGTVLKVLHALDQTNPVVPGRQANGWRFRTR